MQGLALCGDELESFLFDRFRERAEILERLLNLGNNLSHCTWFTVRLPDRSATSETRGFRLFANVLTMLAQLPSVRVETILHAPLGVSDGCTDDINRFLRGFLLGVDELENFLNFIQLLFQAVRYSGESVKLLRVELLSLALYLAEVLGRDLHEVVDLGRHRLGF